MKSALVFLALVALSKGVPLTRSLDGRIVNGEDAKEGEIPYQVSLQTLYGFHFCGGSVLNKNYVITAAHCVVGKSASSIQIIAGTTNLNDPKSINLGTEITIHAGYNSADSWVNDIALIKVRTEFDFSKIISSVPLPEAGAKVPDHSVAIVSGWGRLWEGGSSPTKLQRTELIIATHDYCNEVYSTTGLPIYTTHICAYNPEVESGSCHGDSGGPLTVDGKLAGLVSWAHGCASIKYPTVYTRVAEYIDWINAHAV